MEHKEYCHWLCPIFKIRKLVLLWSSFLTYIKYIIFYMCRIFHKKWENLKETPCIPSCESRCLTVPGVGALTVCNHDPPFQLNMQLRNVRAKWISMNRVKSSVKWSGSVVSDSLQPMNYSLPGSLVHGILQARILEWVAISFSRGSYYH